jgi:hypothetical protein
MIAGSIPGLFDSFVPCFGSFDLATSISYLRL